MIPERITPRTFLEVALRRRWALTAPLVGALMLAAGLGAVLPRLYKSEATILIQPQEVPASYVTPTVTYGVEERLQALSQQIMSRTRLVAIAREFHLYPELASKPEEYLIEQMRGDTELAALRDQLDLGGNKEWRQAKDVVYFTLSFAYRSPETAKQVTERLTQLFIEENRKTRTEQARETTAFLDRELVRTKARLEAKERSLNAYRQDHLGELPEQLEANLNALTRLQTELQTNQGSLSAAEERAVLIQRALAEFTQAQIAKNPGSVIPPPTLFAGPPEARLAALKESLPSLEARYKPSHPNVIKTKNEIARLEAELARHPAAGGGDKPPLPLTGPGYDRDLGTQLIAVKADIARLKQEQEAILGKIGFYQQRVDATPRRDQELARLRRDYELLQANHQSLLQKRTEAKMAENLKDKGEQFVIIDPASLPERPFKPSKLKLFAVALLLGLAGGLGLAFGLEGADRTFKDVDDLEEYLRLSVLAMIPLLKSEQELKQERRRRWLLAAAGVAALLLYGGLIFYARYGAAAA